MTYIIKQWVEKQIQDMKDQARPGQECPLLDDWIKYEKNIVSEVIMMYDNSACWNNINPEDQNKIVHDIIDELRAEETNEQSEDN